MLFGLVGCLCLTPDFIDDSRCIGRILSTSGNSDTGSWFSIWEAAAAIFSKCLRHGSAGVARGLGMTLEFLWWPSRESAD